MSLTKIKSSLTSKLELFCYFSHTNVFLFLFLYYLKWYNPLSLYCGWWLALWSTRAEYVSMSSTSITILPSGNYKLSRKNLLFKQMQEHVLSSCLFHYKELSMLCNFDLLPCLFVCVCVCIPERERKERFWFTFLFYPCGKLLSNPLSAVVIGHWSERTVCCSAIFTFSLIILIILL